MFIHVRQFPPADRRSAADGCSGAWSWFLCRSVGSVLVQHAETPRRRVLVSEAGASWTQIGAALGMSKQGAPDWYRGKIAEQERYVGDLHDTERAKAALVTDAHAWSRRRVAGPRASPSTRSCTTLPEPTLHNPQ